MYDHMSKEQLRQEKERLNRKIAEIHEKQQFLDDHIKLLEEVKKGWEYGQQLTPRQAWAIHTALQAHCGKYACQLIDADAGIVIPEHAVGPQFQNHLPHALEEAKVLLWQPDIWATAVSDYAAFEDIPLREEELPYMPEHWVFATPWAVGGELMSLWEIPEQSLWWSVLVAPYRLSAKMGTNTERGLATAFFFVSMGQQGKKPAELMCVDPGLPLGQSSQTTFRAIIRAALFFRQQQRIVEEQPGNIPRAERRRAQKKQQKIPDVRIVALRRTASSGATAKEPTTREWSCRWLVKHHIRRWTDRATGELRPVFVREHVKGPEGKPLRPPRPTIHRVSR